MVVGFLSCEDPVEEIEDETGHLGDFVTAQRILLRTTSVNMGGLQFKHCLFYLIELPIIPRIPAEKVVFYIHLSSHLSL